MKVAAQKSAELTRLSTLIDQVDFAMFTTLDADGALTSRPMAVRAMDGDGALWFFTDRYSTTLEHLRVVNLSFADSNQATYVSISGHGEIHVDVQHIKELWTPLARPWFPDGPTSANIALLKVVPQAAEYWDAPHSKMVRILAMAASVVAGRPVGMGTHDRLNDPA